MKNQLKKEKNTKYTGKRLQKNKKKAIIVTVKK